MSDILLRVTGLKTHFPIIEGAFFQKVVQSVKAVDGVSLTVKQGEILGLVGESGCGKSTLGRSIVKLLPLTAGEVEINGQKVSELEGETLRLARTDFQMIFQDPYATLNPRMTVFDTLAEPLLLHKICQKSELPTKVSQLMKKVGLAPRFMKKYPHEFSGGQRQRIAIARALALEPKLIIADEPVSALDVSIQSQILNLLSELSREFNLTMIFISHDLSVVKHLCDRVAVMYLGKIVELATAEDLFANPQHPYTKALLSAIPLPDPKKERERQRVFLKGDPPSPIDPPTGCHFHPRCEFAKSECAKNQQTLKGENHQVACEVFS